VSETIMTAERMQRAKELNPIRYRVQLIRWVLLFCYLLLLIFGLGAWLWERTFQPALYVVTLFGLYALLSLPANLYMFHQSRRFGLEVQSTPGWLLDQLKGFLLALLINGSMALLILWLWRTLPQTWHWWVTGAAILGYLLIGLIAPVLLMPLFHKYRPLEEGELKERLLALSYRAQVWVKGCYVADVSRKQTTLNAQLTGIGATRRIVLYDTMIEACTPDEVEVIMAHEMAHHRYNHILKGTIMYSVFMAGLFLGSGYLLEPLARSLGLGGLTPPALPLVGLLFFGLGLAAMPALMVVSRGWERDCDRFALDQTGDPAAFIAAFQKLANRNLADLDPPRWVYLFFGSHPTVPERVEMARGWKTEKVPG
jgi:STE24 endopeptidase